MKKNKIEHKFKKRMRDDEKNMKKIKNKNPCYQ